MPDPFDLMSRADCSNWPETSDPHADAARNFDPERPEQLRDLLLSQGPLVSRRGLNVFANLDRSRNHAVVKDAMRVSTHPDWMARSHLLDGMLSLSKTTLASLGPADLKGILDLIDDPSEVVREKAIVFLSLLTPATISETIALEPSPQRRFTLQTGQRRLEAPPGDDVQAALDSTLKGDPLVSAFVLAGLLRWAERGQIKTPPIHQGNDYVAYGICFQIQRRAAAFRRRSGDQLGREEISRCIGTQK